MVEAVRNLLESLPGVKDIRQLDKKHIPDILSAEAHYATGHVVKVSNLGLHTVLVRDTVFVVLKNHTFRKPPVPTLYLVEDLKPEEVEARQAAGHILWVGQSPFHVVGEEYFEHTAHYTENHRITAAGIVLFPERISTNPRREAYFLLPPIPFPEIEQSEYAGRVSNVMSVSPSVITDDTVRKLYDLPVGTEYATLFVGFDLIQEGTA